jgi:hypothetical protein
MRGDLIADCGLERAMRLSLEYQVTFADFLRLVSARRSRWSLIVRRVFAAVLLLFAFQQLWTSGPNWTAGIAIVVAIIVSVPLYASFLFV